VFTTEFDDLTPYLITGVASLSKLRSSRFSMLASGRPEVRPAAPMSITYSSIGSLLTLQRLRQLSRSGLGFKITAPLCSEGGFSQQPCGLQILD
jgi:hypothetical protein